MGRSTPTKHDLRAMRAALAGLRGAALNVCSAWPSGSDQVSVTEALEREYPFEQPFDELALELAEWADSAIREIDTAIKYGKAGAEPHVCPRSPKLRGCHGYVTP